MIRHTPLFRPVALLAAAGLSSSIAAQGLEFRTIDGTNNNLSHLAMGAADTMLKRLMPEDYGDGSSTPAGTDRPGARAISNAICAQSGSVPAPEAVTDFFWQWGQFLDHDLDLTMAADPAEPMPIPVPLGDPFFDPFGTGTMTIPLNRSLFEMDAGNIRQQRNQITGWIDASNVYGSDPARALALRTLDGTGRLKTTAHASGDLLPFNLNGLPNDGGPDPSLFLAGDLRCNEQVGLTAMHTLFMREHNTLVDYLHVRAPGLSGDLYYELARLIVGAELQAITYKEFLPLLLGPSTMTPYIGYQPRVNASIANFFSTCAYRFGHTMLSPQLMRLDENGASIGDLPLRNAFFSPGQITDNGGIEPLLRGLATQRPQALDTLIVDDVRNFLFGPPGSGGFDLASLNVQRGRDHGLMSYNEARQAYGLYSKHRFEEITSDVDLQNRLRNTYDRVRDIDPWIGGLAEDKSGPAMVGSLFRKALSDQFERLRDGDRFWYQRWLPPVLIDFVERQTLAEVILRNTSIDTIQPNVFVQASSNP